MLRFIFLCALTVFYVSAMPSGISTAEQMVTKYLENIPVKGTS